MPADLPAVATTLRAQLSARYHTDEITPDTWWLSLSRTALGAVAMVPALSWLRSVLDVLDSGSASAISGFPTTRFLKGADTSTVAVV